MHQMSYKSCQQFLTCSSLECLFSRSHSIASLNSLFLFLKNVFNPGDLITCYFIFF